MRCRTAQRLLALHHDAEAEPRIWPKLDAHLRNCASCRLFREALHTQHAALTALASDARTTPGPSPAFAPRLHAALLDSNSFREARPISALTARWQAFAYASNRSCKWRRRLLALPVALALALLLAISQPPTPLEQPQCGTVHLASFSVRQSRDGRLIASVAVQSAATTPDGRGGLR